MSTIAILLVVLSAVMHAVRSFLTKRAYDKLAFIWWYEIFGILFFSPVFAAAVFREGIELSNSFLFIVASGFVHFLYWIFVAKSFENGDLSHVYPIMRSSPALVLLFSVLVLREDVSLAGVVGIMVVALGVYSINMKTISFSEALEPISAVRSERATQFALLTLCCVTAYSIIDKTAVTRLHPIIFAFLYPCFSLGLLSGYVHRAKSKTTIVSEWIAHKYTIMLCGFLSVFGYFLILIAFTTERVSYVVGLRQLSVVFAVFLGGQVLKEEHQMIRLTAAVLIFAGAFLISLAE
jgi:uncharacterized membrane protein